MQLSTTVFFHISLLISLLLLLDVEAYYRNDVVSSPWLKKVEHDHPHGPGCSGKPFMCKKLGEESSARMRCCGGRCVDVASDVNHCGFCRKSCSFLKQCCRGFCVDTNVSKFHCGKCGNKCPFKVRCAFGMCGYGDPAQGPRSPKGKGKGVHPPKGNWPPAMDYQSS